MSDIKEFLRANGQAGGRAGRGKVKRRSPEHYRMMAAESARKRREKKNDKLKGE